MAMLTFLLIVFACIYKIIVITFSIILWEVIMKTLIILSVTILLYICLKSLFRKTLRVRMIIGGHEVDYIFADKDALGDWLITHIGTYDGWREIK
jgi:hypothetical protein